MVLEIIWDWFEKEDDEKSILNRKEQIKKQVFEIIWKITSKYAFVDLSNWIDIDLTKLNSQKEFISFVDEFFSENFYFKNLDYEIFSKIIFDFEKIENKKIKLADDILKIDPQRANKYSKPVIYHWNQAEYTFSKTYSEVLDANWKTLEIEDTLDIDEFIMSMWNFWIKYWLEIDDIKKAIELKLQQKLTIANYTKIIDWEDSYIKSMRHFWIDLSLVSRKNEVDLKNYKRAFVEIGSWEKLYKIIPKKDPIPGMDIFWIRLKPEKQPKEVDLEKVIWEWVTLKEINWELFIISISKWFITPIQWVYYTKDTKEANWEFLDIRLWHILNKVKITPYISLWIIWPKSWNVSTEHDVLVEWVNSWYAISWWNITSLGEASWSMFANWNIKIKWSVIWQIQSYSNSKENIFSWEKDWQIISNWGNIEISWNLLLNSVVSAIKWFVKINTSEVSIILWKDIEIKDAKSCFIFWENIKITWNMINCTIISSWKIEINSMSTQRWENNIFFVKKPNYTTILENINLLIENNNNLLLENQSIIEEINAENNVLSKDQRTILIIPILKKIKAKIKLTQEEIELYNSNYSIFLDFFDKYQKNKKLIEDLLIKNKIVLEKLSILKKQLEKFTKLLEDINTLPKNELFVKLNQSKGFLWYINLPNFKLFSDLELENLMELNVWKNMSYFSILEIEKYFKTEEIQKLDMWKVAFLEK